MSKQKTTVEFIAQAITKHGDKYDYSHVEYLKNHEKVKIICKKHGAFLQTPASHLTGRGCASCAGCKKLTTEIFISRSKKVHGDYYLYGKSLYKNNRTKVILTCPVHGDFKQIPDDHMIGKGCHKCGIGSRAEKRSMDQDLFLSKAKDVHGDKYDYTWVRYDRSFEKVYIGCRKHGMFMMTPSDHLSGRGCAGCANRGMDLNAKAILYYLKIKHNGLILYKIGITNKSVEKRYSKSNGKYTVLFQQDFSTGVLALKKETSIKKANKEFRYYGSPPLKKVGVTEIYTHDILGQDKEAA